MMPIKRADKNSSVFMCMREREREREKSQRARGWEVTESERKCGCALTQIHIYL